MGEKMHFDVRREYWGYEQKDDVNDNKVLTMSATDLHKIKYRGIRPAPGYPSQPDPNELAVIWELLQIGKENIDIELTENFAMSPAASVAGLYIHHKDSKYFQLGQITKEQVRDYHRRRGGADDDLKSTEKWLKSYLAYDPDA